MNLQYMDDMPQVCQFAKEAEMQYLSTNIKIS